MFTVPDCICTTTVKLRRQNNKQCRVFQKNFSVVVVFCPRSDGQMFFSVSVLQWPMIPRWRTCAVSCWGQRRRRLSFRKLGWRLFSPLLSHMAATQTGRREEVDSEGQVLNIGLDKQVWGIQRGFRCRLWVDGWVKRLPCQLCNHRNSWHYVLLFFRKSFRENLEAVQIHC